MSATASSGTDSKEALYCAEQIRIPPELPDIMKNYTKFIIRNQPVDIIGASAEYFARQVKLVQADREAGNAETTISELQLEAFYAKFVKGQDIVIRENIVKACQEISIPSSLLEDLLRLSNQTGDQIQWFKLWSLMVATNAGSLLATLDLAVKLLADNGMVATKPILNVFTTLLERDQSIAKMHDKVTLIKTTLAGKQTMQVSEISAFLRDNVPVVPM